MPDFGNLEADGLIKAFQLQPEEVDEAHYNLLGFFGTLDKIAKRLESEGVNWKEGV
ncbi:MAG TPA: hypothetical protein PK720_04220 [bacterium]|nr:hypothetical protein [bacterium]